jgi:3-oxoacyl-[acyl-carrier protein] reductase
MAFMIPRVALVTGAARGLGAEIARALARDGHAVAVNDLPGSAAGKGVAERLRAEGATAAFFGADVTDEEAVRGLVGAVRDWQGPVDVLVCNAAGPQPVIGVADLTWPDLLDPLLFFVKSPTLLVQAVLPGMKEKGRGRIVNVGSDLPERAEPGWSAYCAAKAAQLALTRVWARELGPHGITVNLVAPGWIPVERHEGTPAEVVDEFTRAVPLGHLGAPADVAAVVTFLASDAARFVTAERVAVNGGHTIA